MKAYILERKPGVESIRALRALSPAMHARVSYYKLTLTIDELCKAVGRRTYAAKRTSKCVQYVCST